MWWRRKKQSENQNINPLSKEKAEQVKQTFEVGKTTVEVRFTDDIVMNMTFYGYRWENFDIDTFEIRSGFYDSKETYHNYINSHKGSYSHWNDSLNPTESHSGTILHTKVISTVPYQREFTVAKKISS